MIGSARIYKAGCIIAKGVPSGRGWDLIVDKEVEKESVRANYQDPDQFVLSCVEIGVHIEDEDQIHQHQILRKIFDGASCSDKEERGKFEDVDVEEVEVVDSSGYDRWKDHCRPHEVRGGIHEVEAEEAHHKASDQIPL
jgi:hypothetical protein